VLAGYLLEEQIGRDGMAVVFRASDERLGVAGHDVGDRPAGLR